MGCSNFLETAFQSVQCTLVLISATIYRAILFLTFLSASVGPATLVCYLYSRVLGRETYQEVQPAISMMLLSCWADFSIAIERRFCSHVLERFKNGFPNVMSFGRFSVHFALYVTAFCELYLEFEKAYSIPEPHKVRHMFFPRKAKVYEEVMSNDEERVTMADANQETHETLFLFALAYLVFVTSRNFHKDLLLVVRNLPSVTFSMLNGWLIRIAFAVLHAFVNLFYFLPCIGIAYTATSYKTSGFTIYFQLTFTAAMSGMIAALFELNRPWPQLRGQLPFLFYENNIFGKNLLAHALVVGILFFFYKPKNTKKVVESEFQSTNSNVLNFCLIVAFTTLHIVKFGVHAVLSLAHEYDQRMHEINNVVVALPAARDSSSRNDSHSHQDGGAGNNAVGGGGMCTRCIANMLNNNSDVPPPATPNVNQNNDTSCAEPQGELVQGRTEPTSALEKEEENASTVNEESQNPERENNEIASDKVEIEQNQHCSGIVSEGNYDVNEISASVGAEFQHHQSCKPPNLDFQIVDENNNEIHSD